MRRRCAEGGATGAGAGEDGEVGEVEAAWGDAVGNDEEDDAEEEEEMVVESEMGGGPPGGGRHPAAEEGGWVAVDADCGAAAMAAVEAAVETGGGKAEAGKATVGR